MVVESIGSADETRITENANICMFPHMAQSRISGRILLAHVDDLLFDASDLLRHKLTAAIKSLRDGELKTFFDGTPIAFTGLQIEVDQQRSIPLSQEHYVKARPVLGAESRIQHNGITNPSDLRSTLRKAICALLWAHRALADIGYTIASMSTPSASA